MKSSLVKPVGSSPSEIGFGWGVWKNLCIDDNLTSLSESLSVRLHPEEQTSCDD